MGVLVDHQIRKLSIGERQGEFAWIRPLEPLLTPFSEGVQGEGVISYGLSHAGYDLRLGTKALVFINTTNEIMDPKAFKQDPNCQKRVFYELNDLKKGDRVIIPPHSYMLGYSLEYIRMPKNLKGTCVGKSTLARCGVLVNTTPLEPGWHGHLTIEIGNISPCPVAIYASEGVAQLEFHTLDAEPEKDYESKQGKYQAQGAEPVPARVKE